MSKKRALTTDKRDIMTNKAVLATVTRALATDKHISTPPDEKSYCFYEIIPECYSRLSVVEWEAGISQYGWVRFF